MVVIEGLEWGSERQIFDHVRPLSWVGLSQIRPIHSACEWSKSSALRTL